MRNGPYKNKMKEFRDKAGLTQESLAKRLRLRGFRATASYISQIEAGLKNIPFSLAVAICEELGHEGKNVADIFLPQNYTDSLDGSTCAITKTGTGT